jgi:hypothetical protein
MEIIKACICCGRNVPSPEDIFCEGYFCRFNQCEEVVENIRCVRSCLSGSSLCETHKNKRLNEFNLPQGDIKCKCCHKMAKVGTVFCQGSSCPEQCRGHTNGKECQNVFSRNRRRLPLCSVHELELTVEKYIFEPDLCICGSFVKNGPFCCGTYCLCYQCEVITSSGRCPNRVASASAIKCYVHGGNYKKDKDV